MKPIEPERPRPVVLIATPSHDHKLNVCMAVSVMNLMASRKVAFRMFIPGQSGIAKGRNHCLWNLLNDFPEATHIHFWDSDIEAKVEMLPMLLERDVPVVGWLYSHKNERLRWCLNITKPPGAKEGDEVEPYKDGPLAGLLPVDTLGTGGMLVKREALKLVLEKFGDELAYIEDQESDGGSTPIGAKSYAFCQERIVSENGPEDKLERIKALLAEPGADFYSEVRKIAEEPQLPGRYYTEDWFLCRLFKRAGIPMYVDTRFHVLHEGMNRFPAVKYRSPPWVEKKDEQAAAEAQTATPDGV